MYCCVRLLFAFTFLYTSSFAQKKISVEDFTTRQTFSMNSVAGISWMNDGKFYTTLSGNKIVRYDITTGEAQGTLVDGSSLSTPVKIESYSFSADEKKLLLATNTKSIYRRSFIADYYVFDLATKTLTRLSEGGKQSYATFSPDGTRVAFVRANNLFVVSMADKKEIRVTSDGIFNRIINGTTDWVYEEEFGFVVGFAWSPDSKKIAYYRFDETDVKEYNLQVWGDKVYPVDYRFKYPKAGEKNSVVEVWIYQVDSGNKAKADLGNEKDQYVPRMMWTGNPDVLMVLAMNRLQNELKFFTVEAAAGNSKVIRREKSETYIELEFVDDVIFLNEGKHFIGTSESAGFKHAFLYTAAGALVKQLTSGNYEISQLLGYDEKNKVLYYTSTEGSPLERHLHSITLDGKKKLRLTAQGGQHSINMSPDFQFYIDQHSSAVQPLVATLYRTRNNQSIKVLEKNEGLAATAKEYQLATKEFFTFTSADGSELHGYFLKPADFVAGKKYPVILYQYSGPGSQNVANSWGGSHYYFHQMLAQRGVVVAVVDTRGTGARGEKFKKLTYKQLGRYELEDLVEAAKYFGSQPWADSNRMGVWGWSYGGYMAALAMTKAAGTFALGIAVAPVTNWRFYDTIYTERYLQTPQLNATGYDDNSPLSHAAKLNGKFLLIHGTGDDNVHVQNSIELQEALINAGKDFQSFFYPDKHHGIQGATTRLHLYTMMYQYIDENL